MPLALGTVQLGLDYGVLNTEGQPDAPEVDRILTRALSAGLETLDTARIYGDSEEQIGQWLRGSANAATLPAPRLVTKLAPLSRAEPGRGAVEHARASWERSLEALSPAQPAALLVHHADDLLSAEGPALWDFMAGLGLERIGVSIYSVAEGFALLERYPLEIMQLPMNIFDQRPEREGLLAACWEAGVEVHIRSILLQGIIAASAEDLERAPSPLRESAALHMGTLSHLGQEVGASPLALALAYGEWVLRGAPGRVLCGVNTARQLEEVLREHAVAVELLVTRPDLPERWAALASADSAFLDPRQWPKRPKL